MIDFRTNDYWKIYIHIIPRSISKHDYDKYYVGITSQSLESRWGKKGIQYKNQNKHFWNAIQKYGWDNIEHELFASALTFEEVCKMEKQLISILQSFGKYGYNLSPGGDGLEELNAKTVYIFDDKGNYFNQYKSAKSASKDLGIQVGTIKSSAKNKNLTSRIGFYARYEEDVIFDGITYHPKQDIGGTPNSKPIYVFDLECNYLQCYKTAAIAAKELGISQAAIKDNANRQNYKNWSKYYFRYQNGVIKTGDSYKMKNEPPSQNIHLFDNDHNHLRIFKNIQSASDFLKLPVHTLSQILRCRQNCSKYNVVLKYEEDVEYRDNVYSIKEDVHKRKKEIYWFKNNVFQKKFDSALIASQYTHINKGTIAYRAMHKTRRPRNGDDNLFRYQENVKKNGNTYYIDDNEIPASPFKIFVFDETQRLIDKGINSLQLAEKYNTTSTNIVNCARRKGTSGSLFWRYKEDVKELEDGSYIMLR